jgi:hypothetical protein
MLPLRQRHFLSLPLLRHHRKCHHCAETRARPLSGTIGSMQRIRPLLSCGHLRVLATLLAQESSLVLSIYKQVDACFILYRTTLCLVASFPRTLSAHFLSAMDIKKANGVDRIVPRRPTNQLSVRNCSGHGARMKGHREGGFMYLQVQRGYHTRPFTRGIQVNEACTMEELYLIICGTDHHHGLDMRSRLIDFSTYLPGEWISFVH